MIITTIASSNYLAHVRTLMASVAAHEPDARRIVLIVDRPVPIGDEPFEVVFAQDIGIERWRHFSFKYGILELNTAVKPFWLEYLLNECDDDQAVYFDPDIVLYRSLDGLRHTLDGSMCVLTPHLLAPVEFDGHRQTELDILGAGTFNLGFFAIRKVGEWQDMLRWWQRRLYSHCRITRDMSLFTDQKWMNLAPGLFDGVHIWQDPGANVAYWNIAQRYPEVTRDTRRTKMIEYTSTRTTLRDEVPIFFHFSGFRPDAPDILSTHQTRLTIPDLTPRLQRMFADYANALITNGWDSIRKLPYTYGLFDDGEAITDTMRGLLLHLDPDGFRWPNPFDGSFQDFLYCPIDSNGLMSVLGDIETSNLGYNMQRRAEYLALNMPHMIARKSLRRGLNIIGYLKSETGVGQVARSMTQACKAINIPFGVTPLTSGDVAALDDNHTNDMPFGAPYQVNLHCVNLDMASRVRADLPHSLYDNYRIGNAHWELSDLPQPFVSEMSDFNEFWVSSNFIADTLRQHTSVPVHTIPPVISFGKPNLDRSHFGLPNEAFIVMFMFDFNSVFERKNPLAVVEAFKKADLPNSLLVIKTTNINKYPEQAKLLVDAVESVNGYVYDNYTSRNVAYGLLSCADAYVSLHRSEGFGLTMAEAMLLGIPTIGTDYGGNTDFMTSKNSWLVDYDLAELDQQYGPYPAGSVWADPNTDMAAQHLQEVYKDPGPKPFEAGHTIRWFNAPIRIGNMIEHRLGEIYDSL